MSNLLFDYPYSAFATGILDLQQFTIELAGLLKREPAEGKLAIAQIKALYNQVKLKQTDYDRLCLMVAEITGYKVDCASVAPITGSHNTDSKLERTQLSAHLQTPREENETTALFDQPLDQQSEGDLNHTYIDRHSDEHIDKYLEKHNIKSRSEIEETSIFSSDQVEKPLKEAYSDDLTTVLQRPSVKSTPHSWSSDETSEFISPIISTPASDTKDIAPSSNDLEATEIRTPPAEAIFSEVPRPKTEPLHTPLKFSGIQHPKRSDHTNVDRLEKRNVPPFHSLLQNILTPIRHHLPKAALSTAAIAGITVLFYWLQTYLPSSEHNDNDNAFTPTTPHASTRTTTQTGNAPTLQASSSPLRLETNVKQLHLTASQAAAAGKLEPLHDMGSALAILEQMLRVNPDAPEIKSIRVKIAQAYLSQAKEARLKDLWELAEKYVDKAIFIRNEASQPKDLPK